MEAGEFVSRRAPYAPISSLRDFLDRMRSIGVPARVDRRFLQKLNVASNNEWALLSALKFLGIVDEHGSPTHAYRLLQGDRFEDTFRHLVETAYAALFDIGGSRMGHEDLVNYFRVASSPSQAKNAARFFREVCKLAGIDRGAQVQGAQIMQREGLDSLDQADNSEPGIVTRRDDSSPLSTELLRAKALLVEKLPACRDDWSAKEYDSICQRFLDMLHHLEASG